MPTTDLDSAIQVDDVLLDLSSWPGPLAGHFITQLHGIPLVPGQNVSVAIQACNGLGCGSHSSTVILGTAPDVPGAVMAPILTDINETSIQVAIQHPAAYTGGYDIIRYELEITTQPAFLFKMVDLGNIVPTSYFMHERLLSRSYVFRVRAVNALGNGPLSADLLIAGGVADLPDVPVGLHVIPNSLEARRLSVSWTLPDTNSTAPLFYRMEVSSLLCTGGPANCTFTEVLAEKSFITIHDFNCTTGCTAHIASGILPSHVYRFRLASVSSMGASLLSPSTEIITPADVPELLAPPAVTLVDSTSILVVWSLVVDNGSPIYLYRVWACEILSTEQLHLNNTSSPPSCFVQTVVPGFNVSLQATLTPLDPAHNFTVAVEAINDLGSSGNISAAGVHTTRAPPMRGNEPADMNPLPGLSRKTTLRLTWAPPFANGASISHYLLRVDGEPLPVPATPSTPEYTIVGLYPGSWHNITVSAVNYLGGGEESPFALFQTEKDVPGKPQPPILLLLNDTHLIVEAQPPLYSGGDQLLHYEVYNSFSNVTVEVPLSAPALIVVDPVPNSEYRFTSRAVSSQGNGVWSDALIVMSVGMSPPAAPPHAPLCGNGVAGDGGNGTAGDGGPRGPGDEGGDGDQGTQGDGGDQEGGDDEAGEEGAQSACGALESDACGAPDEFCYKDVRCLNNTQADPFGGLGCNAGGYKECRYCGFGLFKSIPCPGGSGDGIADGEGTSALTGGAGAGAGMGMAMMAAGAGALVLAAILVFGSRCRRGRKGGKKKGGSAADLARQKADLEVQLAKAKALNAANGAGNGPGAVAASLAIEKAAVEAELKMLKTQMGLAGDGNGTGSAKAQLAKLAGEKAALEKRLAILASQEAQARANVQEAQVRALAGDVDGNGGDAISAHNTEGSDSDGVMWLRDALHSQAYFEPGVDDHLAMEVNPVMLHDIIVQKKLARAAKAEAIAPIANGSNSEPRKKRPGAPSFGKSGGLARLNLKIDNRKDATGNFETLKSVQAYLSSTGVVGAQDKPKEHCTKPGTNMTALAAAQAFIEDTDHLGVMARSARAARMHSRPRPAQAAGRSSLTTDGGGSSDANGSFQSAPHQLAEENVDRPQTSGNSASERVLQEPGEDEERDIIKI